MCLYVPDLYQRIPEDGKYFTSKFGSSGRNMLQLYQYCRSVIFLLLPLSSSWGTALLAPLQHYIPNTGLFNFAEGIHLDFSDKLYCCAILET